MKIACLGWGSLIWNPGDLNVKKKDWFNDGPLLPIEFIRISSDNRLTLVIDLESKPVPTLWNLFDTEDFQIAFESLRKREGTIKKRIDSFNINSVPSTPIEKTVQEWLKKKRIDVAIWTGLYLNKKNQTNRPTIEQVISHLKGLSEEDLIKAKQYIVKAPTQIKTEYRKLIMDKFGWE